MHPVSSFSSFNSSDALVNSRNPKRKYEQEDTPHSDSSAAKERVRKIFSFLNHKSIEISNALNEPTYGTTFLDRIFSASRPPCFNRLWKDEKGDTLMHYAARLGYKNGIVQLKKLGVSLFVKNHEGKTPWEIALSTEDEDKNMEMKRLLSTLLSSKRSETINKIYGSPPSGDPPLFYPSSSKSKDRIHPGRFVTNDLKLFYQGKRKSCEIPDQSYVPNDPLSLHDRMKYETTLRAKNPKLSSDNSVMACLGLIVSTKPYSQKKEADYKVEFLNVPINHPDFEVFFQDPQNQIHTERQLYQYIGQKKVAAQLIDQFETNYKIHSGFKIYGVILDLYSQREMCVECEEATYDKESESTLTEKTASYFLHQFETVWAEKGYVLPKKKFNSPPSRNKNVNFPPDALTPSRNYCLPFAARVSCITSYGNHSPLPVDSIGIPYPTFGLIEELGTETEYLPSTPEARNIKQFRNSVILHRGINPTPLPTEKGSLLDYRTQTLFLNTYPKRLNSCTPRNHLQDER